MHDTHLQYRGLVDPLSVDVGLGVSAAWCDGDDALGVSDDAVPRLHVGSEQLQGLTLRVR